MSGRTSRFWNFRSVTGGRFVSMRVLVSGRTRRSGGEELFRKVHESNVGCHVGPARFDAFARVLFRREHTLEPFGESGANPGLSLRGQMRRVAGGERRVGGLHAWLDLLSGLEAGERLALTRAMQAHQR